MASVEWDSGFVHARLEVAEKFQRSNGPELPRVPTARQPDEFRPSPSNLPERRSHAPAGAMPRRVTSLAAPHASLAALCFLALAAVALPSALALECDEAMTGFHDNDIKSQAWQDIRARQRRLSATPWPTIRATR